MVNTESSWKEKFKATKEILWINRDEEKIVQELYNQFRAEWDEAAHVSYKELLGPDKAPIASWILNPSLDIVQNKYHRKIIDRAIEKGKTRDFGAATLIREEDHIVVVSGFGWERNMLVWKMGDETTYVLNSYGLIGKYDGSLYNNIHHSGNTGSFSGVPPHVIKKANYNITDMNAKLVNREKATEIAGVVKKIFPFANIPLEEKVYASLNN